MTTKTNGLNHTTPSPLSNQAKLLKLGIKVCSGGRGEWQHSTMDSGLASRHSSPIFGSQHSWNYIIGKNVAAVEVNQWRWLEESWLWLENDDRAHLVLASGKLALQKSLKWVPLTAFSFAGWLENYMSLLVCFPLTLPPNFFLSKFWPIFIFSRSLESESDTGLLGPVEKLQRVLLLLSNFCSGITLPSLSDPC